MIDIIYVIAFSRKKDELQNEKAIVDKTFSWKLSMDFVSGQLRS